MTGVTLVLAPVARGRPGECCRLAPPIHFRLHLYRPLSSYTALRPTEGGGRGFPFAFYGFPLGQMAAGRLYFDRHLPVDLATAWLLGKLPPALDHTQHNCCSL